MTTSHLWSKRHLHQLVGIPFAELKELAAHAGAFYEPFDHRRVDSNKWRHIDCPNRTLKDIQKRILRGILKDFPLPDYLFGTYPKRNPLSHARLHLGQETVVTLDLRDYFPRTHNHDVYRTFRRTLGCSSTIAAVLTQLTTLQHRLPQGAPTSALMAHLSSLSMFEELHRLCARSGCRFSAYVDDIAVSGAASRSVIEPVVQAIHRHGHRIGRKKTRVMSRTSGQIVIGNVLGNNSLEVPRRCIDEIIDTIAEVSRLPASDVPETSLRSIRGRIQHVRQVNPDQATELEALLSSLPVSGKPGTPARKFLTRRCRHSCRHKRHRTALDMATTRERRLAG